MPTGNKIRVLIAGSDEVWSLEKYYRKYLEEAGFEVGLVPVQSLFYRYYNGNLLHKMLFKAGVAGIGREIAEIVKQKIREWKPDVLWVFKGMELSPEILKWAREEKVFLMNYNPDNPFLFSGRGSGNRNVAESIGLYDLHLTYDGSVKERIGREYGITCLSLPFGFELSDAVWEKCRAQEEVKKLCFVGNPDKQRAAFIRELADDFALDIYGHGWSNFIRHHNVTICPPVYDEEFWKALYRYRGQLNLMRLHNPDSHNMRSFEVPGVGGIGLFPRTGDHTQFFEEGREVFLYGDMKECRKWAGNLLSMTDSQAGEIRRAARRRSLESKYSYRDRSFQVTAIIKEFCL